MAHIPGNLKYHRSGNTELRELEFPGALSMQSTVMQDLNAAIGTHALQTRNAAPTGFQLHQRRPKLGRPMPQLCQQLIAGHGTAQLCTCQAAAGYNQFVAEVLLDSI